MFVRLVEVTLEGGGLRGNLDLTDLQSPFSTQSLQGASGVRVEILPWLCFALITYSRARLW